MAGRSPAEVIMGYGIKYYFEYNFKYILFSRHGRDRWPNLVYNAQPTLSLFPEGTAHSPNKSVSSKLLGIWADIVWKGYWFWHSVWKEEAGLGISYEIGFKIHKRWSKVRFRYKHAPFPVKSEELPLTGGRAVSPLLSWTPSTIVCLHLEISSLEKITEQYVYRIGLLNRFRFSSRA